METLNMSKLNLSSVRSTVAADNASKQDVLEPKFETLILMDPDDDYNCEYREDIWKNLLEQDAQKPPIHLQSPQLEFRGALVQQLRDVTKKLGLTLATLHSAVAQLDLFMDAHRLRADRLTHVALACLSLAAKSEEKFSRAPTLKTLSKTSGVQLCSKMFRQLEWMVGQHVRWRLLAPTPATFAALLAPYVVADCDLSTRHPKFVRRFRRDGAKLLEAYLDLTLSDVRLKVVESADVGCACVACARAALGLSAWPAWLAARAGRPPAAVAPVARLLQRMMQILKSREAADTDVDQGYSSARTSPNITPCTSPQYENSPASSTCSTSRSFQNNESYRQHPTRSDDYTVLDLEDSEVPEGSEVQRNLDYRRLPIDMTCQRVGNPTDYSFCRSSRLIEASLNPVATTSMGIKRSLDPGHEYDAKRYRLSQMSQVVL
ncbi:uncharacterized protein LOC123664050 [Melitaea cinxia]|uniref:uncharacterized protein LOC123664050 n=1 Tax=Melitaea cinxia TaxID=113334 RepID=UPI001E274146|nr:uncharacterized protein LOC123664050 [Melitaea cinxia]